MALLLGSLLGCILMLHSLVTANQHQSPAFEGDERFLDLFPLTKDNFTESVLKSRDPWVVLFHSGSLTKSWKTMAVQLRGVVWMGMVDTREEAELLAAIKYTPNYDPEARIYPHGPMSIKKKNWKYAKNPNEARLMATDSIPDQSLKVKGKALHEYFMDGYLTKPSRFPVLLLSDEVDTPVPYRALSNRFSKYFNFGRMMNPTLEDYKALGLEEYFLETPLLFVLIAEVYEGAEDNPHATSNNFGFSAIQFDTKKHGPMNYPNVMQFLFAINYNFRYKLPGDNMSNDKEVAEMSDILEAEKKRFDVSAYDKNISSKSTQKDSDNDIQFKTTTMGGFESVKDEL